MAMVWHVGGLLILLRMIFNSFQQGMIRNKSELKAFLRKELPRNKTNFLCYLFQVSERDIIRKYIKLLRKTKYYKNAKKQFAI